MGNKEGNTDEEEEEKGGRRVEGEEEGRFEEKVDTPPAEGREEWGPKPTPVAGSAL